MFIGTCFACIRPLSLSVSSLCLCVTLYQHRTPVFGCGVESADPGQGSVFSLTCLRLHREIRLSLEYAVHQPGTVAVGGVISICSCHLHHWRTYRTDTHTWQTSQESTSLIRFKSGVTNKLVTESLPIHLPAPAACRKRMKNTLSLLSDAASELHLWGWSPLLFLDISSLPGRNIHSPILVIFMF